MCLTSGDQALFLCLAPLIAGSLLTASPTLAATFAVSEARVTLDNFSHTPRGIHTLTDTETSAIATQGKATAVAKADATFTPNIFGSTLANNYSLSQVTGDGENYLALAKSFAAIIGYNFIIKSGETFSFDFQASLDLEISIDNPRLEEGRADGILSLRLYDYTNTNQESLLDSFFISSSLETIGDDDSLDYQHSTNITFNPSTTAFKHSFGEKTEFAKAAVQGSYSRTFDSLTKLMLIEGKINKVSVKAKIPESSSWIALLAFTLLCIGYEIKTKTSHQGME